VCAECTQTRPFQDPEFLARPEVRAKLSDLAGRIQSEAPLRRSDDPVGWDWRAFLRERSATP